MKIMTAKATLTRWRASPGTPGKARCGLQAIVYRRRSIRRWRVGGSSNASRYPRSFRPTGCIGPRNGICAKSLSCLLVAEPLPSDLLLSAKYLRFVADAAVRSARLASLRSRVGAPVASPITRRRPDGKILFSSKPLAISRPETPQRRATGKFFRGTHHDGFLAVTFHELESIIRPFER